MQCPIMVAKKVTRYSNFNDASNACNENSNCFAIYDVKCRGTEYYECENEEKWNNLTSFSKKSDYSCLHFKHNVGNLGNFMMISFLILTNIHKFRTLLLIVFTNYFSTQIKSMKDTKDWTTKNVTNKS